MLIEYHVDVVVVVIVAAAVAPSERHDYSLAVPFGYHPVGSVILPCIHVSDSQFGRP